VNVNKIIIVGGGSAGWMSAATLVKYFPEKDITVIESPNIPTIGVGESTLGAIRNWIRALEINEDDFMKFTNASYKMGIRFKNFYYLGDGGYFHPFGRPFTHTFHSEGFNESDVLKLWHIKKSKDKDLPPQDYCKTFWPTIPLMEKGKFSDNSSGEFDNYHPKTTLAYHFDAVKFAIWLRDSYSKPKGVKHVQAEVVEVIKNSDGIEYLVLDSGEKVYSDLFVDCTGFKSLLLGEALNETFISYHDLLPNNKAWAVQIPYTDKEKELEPLTECTALSNGWVWNVPLWSRIGTGYVYSDKYITKEEALEEFKAYLNSDKMKVYNPNRVTDNLQFRHIETKIGRYERMFVKNVVAIGLSSGFIEPLESNGLLSVHRFLFFLITALQRGSVSQLDKNIYNVSCNTMFDNFAEFVALHYLLTKRDDTQYWRDWKNKDIEIDNSKLDSMFYEAAAIKIFDEKQRPGSLLHCIAAGMEFYNYTAQWTIPDPLGPTKYELKLDNFKENTEYLKKKWEEAAKNSETLYEYLKRKYNETE
jgi:tryptophan halogenase